MPKTIEKKTAVRNGIGRMAFTVLSILVEVLIILILMTKLYDYAMWVSIFYRLLGIVIVLGIYGAHWTASMKMPWLILITAFPLFGVTLYLLIGLNGHTLTMAGRYQKIDDMLLPMIEQKDKIMEELRESDLSVAGISTYIKRRAGYPVYRNTDVTYYDEAARGLDAQIEEMEKATRFIFLEYHAIDTESGRGRRGADSLRRYGQHWLYQYGFHEADGGAWHSLSGL